MAILRIFFATCPSCNEPFPVNFVLRHADIKLICPNCDHRFLPDEATHIDERV